ncbi:MAG: TetR family transcriptional regulator [Sphingomonadales bacterium]
MASMKRDHLINTALQMFCEYGFHATGVDKIIEQAGVARMTLYKHFKSKDELILATLRRHDEELRNWFMRRVEHLGDTAKARLLCIFDVLDEWFNSEDFTGCMFINASAEYPLPQDPIHRAAREHKILTFEFIRDLAKEAGAEDPDSLAYTLTLIAEGSMVMAYVADDKEAAIKAKVAAERVINALVPDSARVDGHADEHATV